MPDSTEALRAKIAALLQTPENGRLARDLEDLARADDDFAECADLWAPALYDRNALFFEPFLIRHLDAEQDAVVRALAQRAEQDGHDSLFAGLYRKVADEPSWNAEIQQFTASREPDAQVLRAAERRNFPGNTFALQEPLAATLYQRNPATFGAFTRAHALPGYDYSLSRSRDYQELRAAAKARGDVDLYWSLFRRFATPAEWAVELSLLLNQRPPAAQVIAELRQRQLERSLDVDPLILLDFMAQYGAAIIPYIEPNLSWIGHIPADKLLPAVEHMGDVGFYRRVFFRYGDPKSWRQRVQDLAQARLSDAELAHALARWTPPAQQQRNQAWKIDHATALALYQRNADLFRPFLLLTVHEPDAAFFAAAESHGDEELLDALTFGYLDHLSTEIATTYPYVSAITLADLSDKQRAWATELGAQVIARFDRLVAQDPANYARHAALVLSQGVGAAWKLKDDPAPNPVAYLAHQQHAAWRASSFALRELLETPDHTVISFALDLLAHGGKHAAQRVGENLPALQALLLGQDAGKFKKLVLKGIEQAAYADPAIAAQATPMLAEFMHLGGMRAIEERAMVSFVRARSAANDKQSA